MKIICYGLKNGFLIITQETNFVMRLNLTFLEFLEKIRFIKISEYSF